MPALLCSIVGLNFSVSIKEPKEEEMTEEEKAAQKARPVATNPIPGTPWYARHNAEHVISSLYRILIFSSNLPGSS